ncbi:uncharacterized protein LOC108622012 isoform X2 [Ceratina calcarata]|nr:uncharacterized protein LOC108622012 isoform X2 [Ceratina calcarata]
MKYSDIVFPECVDASHGYHSKCRKNFLAMPKKYIEKYEELASEVNASPTSVAVTSTSFANISDSGNIEEGAESAQAMFLSVDREEEEISGQQGRSVHEDANSARNQRRAERICFFCDKHRKVYNHRILPLHSSVAGKLRNNICRIASAGTDREIEGKLDALNVNDTIYYHLPCRQMYLRKYVITRVTHNTDWHKKQKFHELTYSDICGFVETNIINNKECHLLQFLTDCYNEILENFYVEEFQYFDAKYTSQHLLEKLNKTFGDKIQVILIHQKKLIAPRDGCVIDDETFSRFHDFELLSRAALMLRKKILLTPKKPRQISDITGREWEIPKDLADFMQHLVCGIDSRTQKSSDCAGRVDSISQDIMYAVHHGRTKTSKHDFRNDAQKHS